MALSPRDRRAVIILGGVAGVAVVGFLVMNLLGGGGGEVPPPIPAGTGGGTGTQPSTSVTPSPRETLPPVVLAGARDPFSPPPILVSPSGGVSPSSSTSPTTSPTSSPTAPGGGASATLGGHTVVLVDIFSGGTKAQIEVDGTVYTVAVGDRFAGGFRLASISGGCARVTFSGEGATICLNPQK